MCVFACQTTELELEVFFSDFGTVKDVRIVTDRKTGECKGYAIYLTHMALFKKFQLSDIMRRVAEKTFKMTA